MNFQKLKILLRVRHILAVVCCALFVQCSNQAQLSDDIGTLKRQLDDTEDHIKALYKEVSSLRADTRVVQGQYNAYVEENKGRLNMLMGNSKTAAEGLVVLAESHRAYLEAADLHDLQNRRYTDLGQIVSGNSQAASEIGSGRWAIVSAANSMAQPKDYLDNEISSIPSLVPTPTSIGGLGTGGPLEETPFSGS